MKKVASPIVVGNWKMNPQSVSMAKRLVTEIKRGMTHVGGVEIVLVPPFIFVPTAHDVRNGSKKFTLGVQNIHWDNLGARTGETSLPMLKSFDVTHVIIGHSERRELGETDEEIQKKIHATIKAGLTAIVCVGEKKRDQSAHYLSFVENQVQKACAGISKAKLKDLVIAYEPLWAIGTGSNETPEGVHEMKLFIQKILTHMYGRNLARKVRILYGGSVNAKNARSLITEGMVDGFLVGGASLRASEFIDIIKATK